MGLEHVSQTGAARLQSREEVDDAPLRLGAHITGADGRAAFVQRARAGGRNEGEGVGGVVKARNPDELYGQAAITAEAAAAARSRSRARVARLRATRRRTPARRRRRPSPRRPTRQATPPPHNPV